MVFKRFVVLEVVVNTKNKQQTTNCNNKQQTVKEQTVKEQTTNKKQQTIKLFGTI